MEDNPSTNTDADVFWNSVEEQLVARGVPTANEEQFKVQLSYSKWAPYIGEATRNSNLLYNTEFEKVNPSQKIPDVVDAIPEEMVNHLLVHEKVQTIILVNVTPNAA